MERGIQNSSFTLVKYLTKKMKQTNVSLLAYTYPRPIIRKCDANHPPVPGEPCELDVKIFGPCSPNYIDQQSTAEPCVFLKVRHDQEWNPEFYTNSSDLPEDMPRKLSEEIAKNPLKASKVGMFACSSERIIIGNFLDGLDIV